MSRKPTLELRNEKLLWIQKLMNLRSTLDTFDNYIVEALFLYHRLTCNYNTVLIWNFLPHSADFMHAVLLTIIWRLESYKYKVCWTFFNCSCAVSLIVNLSSEHRLLRRGNLTSCTWGTAHLVFRQSIQCPHPLQRSYWLARASCREENLVHARVKSRRNVLESLPRTPWLRPCTSTADCRKDKGTLLQDADEGTLIYHLAGPAIWSLSRIRYPRELSWLVVILIHALC